MLILRTYARQADLAGDNASYAGRVFSKDTLEVSEEYSLKKSRL